LLAEPAPFLSVPQLPDGICFAFGSPEGLCVTKRQKAFQRLWQRAAVVLVCCLLPAILHAQTPAAAPPQPERSDPDVLVDPLQPDFNLAALPTTLRLPRHKWAFRVTHRFTRSLGDGDFGDLLGDAFGVDGSAQVGLELRFGLFSSTQIGVNRTSDRTIEIFGQHNFLNERGGAPLGLDAIVTLEGANNLRGHTESAVGVIVSRSVKRFASLYAEPVFVANSSPFTIGDNSTLMLGLGARVRFRPSAYVFGEITPRLAGFDPGVSQASFGVEYRAGGHLFQLNFSNGYGTTLGQIARGGITNESWFLGFNISRKFY
jgi:hypothetical protein